MSMLLQRRVPAMHASVRFTSRVRHAAHLGGVGVPAVGAYGHHIARASGTPCNARAVHTASVRAAACPSLGAVPMMCRTHGAKNTGGCGGVPGAATARYAALHQRRWFASARGGRERQHPNLCRTQVQVQACVHRAVERVLLAHVEQQAVGATEADPVALPADGVLTEAAMREVAARVATASPASVASGKGKGKGKGKEKGGDAAAETVSVLADFQTEAALQLVKTLKRRPRDIAEDIVAALLADPERPVRRAEVSGPGFINMWLREDQLRASVAELATAGVRVPSDMWTPRPDSDGGGYSSRGRVLLDFGSPNVGKELHVGHLRSSLIGDTLARVLEWQGFDVQRVSHVGDVGVPVALVVTALVERAEAAGAGADVEAWVRDEWTPRQLGHLYADAKRRMASCDDFARRVHATVSRLQAASRDEACTRGGDAAPTWFKVWRGVCDVSMEAHARVFGRLGVDVTPRPESLYTADAPSLVESLLEEGVAHVSQGAVAFQPPMAFGSSQSSDADGAPPMLLRKTDGSSLYATMDAVALRDRLRAGHDHVIVVTDHAQAPHFHSLFQLADSAGWIDDACRTHGHATVPRLTHVPCGVVKGGDGRKLSSRDAASGDAGAAADGDAAAAASGATLEGLLDEGRESARAMVEESGDRLAAGTQDVDHAAETIGCAAARYYELSHQRTKHYVFSFDQALAFKGDTAVYIMYAVARLQALRRAACTQLGVTDVRAGESSGADTATRSHAAATHGLPASVAEFAEEQAALLRSWQPVLEASALQAGLQGPGDNAWGEGVWHTAAAAGDMPDDANGRSVVTSRALAAELGVWLPEQLAGCATDLAPHVLAAGVHRVARAVHTFYVNNRVLAPHDGEGQDGGESGAPEAADSTAPALVRHERLLLCAAADVSIRWGLGLLGIPALDAI